MKASDTDRTSRNDKFFESLNNIGLDNIDSAPNGRRNYHPLDADQRRTLKRMRKAEKRARRQETRHHRDKFSLHEIVPLTANQTRAFEEYRNGKHMMLHGYTGTGKTFISLFLALEDIFNTKGSQYKKVVTIRSVVPSRDIGFLPGSAMEKSRVYEEPYMEICDSLFGEGNGYNILKERGLFEFTTTSFLRGVTFTDSIVIVDEMQNMTFQELDTVMTRIGENCRIIFCGDFRQTDLDKDSDKHGLHKFMAILHKLKGFEYVEFGREDIVRSSIVKDYIIARTESEDRKVSPPRPALGWPLSDFPITPLSTERGFMGVSNYDKPPLNTGMLLNEKV